MPVSMWNSFVFAALLFCVSCELPLIAVTGDTLEAFFRWGQGRQQYNQKTNHCTSNQTAYTELKKRISENRSPLMDSAGGRHTM